MKKLPVLLSLSILLTSCGKIAIPTSGETSDAVITTGSADVSEQSADVCGYLYMSPSEREGCQFGIVYSTDKVPSVQNGVCKYAAEVDPDNRFAVSITSLQESTEYFYTAFLKSASGTLQYGKILSFKTTASKMVDLGLSVKWAICNIGAFGPENAGLYYTWAGLDNVDNYRDDDYEFELVKSIKPEHDVAHVTLGGKWRIPSRKEWLELKNDCTWTWTTLKGMDGYKVTSNKPGFTDKYIFLPAAGYIGNGTGAGIQPFRYGNVGMYWSSDYYATSMQQYAFCVQISAAGKANEKFNLCEDRLSIRPVTD